MIDKVNIVLALISGGLLLSGAWLIPSWVLWIMLWISILLGIFQYLDTRKQPYIHMVAAVFYISGLIGVWIYTFWDERDFLLQPLIVMRIVYGMFLLGLLGMVFAYWRALVAFQYKRGNVDKEKLVSTDEPFSERWKNFKRRLLGQERAEKEDIYLILGEEVDDKR